LAKEQFPGHFLLLVGEGSNSLPISKKLEWDKAVAPFSFLPEENNALKLPESFIKIFSGKKLEAGSASKQLQVNLPNLPDDFLTKDLAARQAMLDVWNSLGTLTVLLDSNIQQDLGKAIKAVSKGLLRPLC